MIQVTIKTLDSQNHTLSVEEDLTVLQFKERIAENIDIPVHMQRLIHCGRVMQDSKILREFNLDGKVVHLVQRAPPNARRPRSPQQDAPNTQQPRLGPTNTMYLGSMSFPVVIPDAQRFLSPPPTQTLSGSRLNVARRMLRRAENLLTALEDPQHVEVNNDVSQDFTPVFAAQVYVPEEIEDVAGSLNEAVSVVTNNVLQGVRSISNQQPTATSSSTVPPTNTSASTSASSNRQQSENAHGTVELSNILDTLFGIHRRFQPFIERYHNFMRTDPLLMDSQLSNTQLLIDRVSEIMHLLGHAYHSISDIMVSVATPPPRPVLCRPIILQQSALMPNGIPIQLEAQINLRHRENAARANNNQRAGNATPQRPETENPSQIAQSSPQTTTTTTVAAATTTPPNAPTNQPRRLFHLSNLLPQLLASQQDPSTHTTQSNIQNFAGAPINITENSTQGIHEIRVEAMRGNQDTAGNNVGRVRRTFPTANGLETNTTARQDSIDPVSDVSFISNPNMEVFMEVTPDSITIDSLETTVVTSAAQADNVLRGSLQTAPPEFLQTILQAVAGHLMNSNDGGGNAPDAVPIVTMEIADQLLNSGPPSTTPNHTNTRSNTQTTNTNTTSTNSRPTRHHVHLAQHEMHSFDPFLPCNSHHNNRYRRLVNQQNAASNASASNPSEANPSESNSSSGTTPASRTEQGNNNRQINPLQELLQGLFQSTSSTAEPDATPTQATNSSSTSSTSVSVTQSTPSTTSAPTEPTAPTMPSTVSQSLSSSAFHTDHIAALDAFSYFDDPGITLDSLLLNFPEHNYIQGESLLSDLVMILARNLTFGDIVSINTGSIDPLIRARPALRAFFLTRVLAGECPTHTSIERGANRLIEELRPMLDLMGTMRAHNNIDIRESATQLCRGRFPQIISLLMSRIGGSLRRCVDHCVMTIRQLCAIAIHGCVDGQQGLEEIFRTFMSQYTIGMAAEIQQWTISTGINQLRQFLNDFDVSAMVIQPYIVNRVVDEIIDEEMPALEASVTEPKLDMKEEQSSPAVNETSEPKPVMDDNNIVVGSEPWHNNVTPNWIPIMTRDANRQRREEAQDPYSDTYLNGMPNKRRKLIAAAKPATNSVSQILSDGVRRAVSTAGLVTAAPIDMVCNAASSDSNLQQSYREMLRSNVRTILRENPDFTPDRFPNAANYFNLK